VGTVQLDERQIYTVAPKFEGWIERLLVNTTGEHVKRGQPLMEVYSPDLITAQQEYLIALRGVKSVQGASSDAQSNMQQLVAGALERLRNWDISDQEVTRLEKEGTVRRNITLRSPVSGVVVEKPALKGMRFMPGEMLYQISDLSSVWLLAEVFEQDLALVQSGQAANITVNAYPGKVFKGKVAFIYPTVTPETRTAKVRVVMPNPGALLKPAMYASVELVSGAGAKKVLAVPDSAILDSGTRQTVLVQRGEGLFEPRPIKVGRSADGYVEILDGIKEGEQIVTSANFLIDSESNLKAALGTFGTSGSPTDAAGASAGTSQVTHQAKGTVRGIDLNTGNIKLEHEAIASLKWPAMTMDFAVADKALLKGVKPGDQVDFELTPRAPGEFAITKLAPARDGRVSSAPAGGHKGH
ncbi:MAG TPA: efflux RND transporter periplasmic adaptor subunit, partial [Burkholderiales bacterium]|nr:efflux RND transporter periplasmic adaptor subunit [Burkholderiales bacterium]